MSEAHPKGYCPLFGNYPKEYNRAVHGPYYAWRDYRPNKDLHFSEVKLGDLKSWLGRREYKPHAVISTMSRYQHLWGRKWLDSRYGAPSKPLLQLLYFCSFISMLGMYGALRAHRNHKYHW